jgi:hypothetical protein
MLTAIAVTVFFVYRVANSAPTGNSVEALALRWFAQMQSGQIDRFQLSTDYSRQLTDAAVHDMSHYLNEYKYGASPTRAELVQTRTIDRQTVYEVKLIYPRGDAATLLMGFNANRQITGISILEMAGD